MLKDLKSEYNALKSNLDEHFNTRIIAMCILIPAYGFRKTQKNVDLNNKVKIDLGSKEVLGYKDYPGTGFIVEGGARYFDSGDEYDMMKNKFSFLTRVLEISVDTAK